MDHLDVYFLNAVGITEVRHPEADICQTRQLAAILTGQGDDLPAFGVGSLDSLEDITGVATGGDTEQHRTTTAYRFPVA